jgi:protoheme ferro-lyase
MKWHNQLLCREDEYLVNMQHTVIPSWYQREGYIKAMATLIEKELFKFPKPQKVRTMSHDLVVFSSLKVEGC